MKEQEFKLKSELIKKEFHDNRTIEYPTPKEITKLDDSVHPGGDIFTTEDGEFIDLELQLRDFDEEELTKYVDFAENLYEKHHRRVSVYLLCPKNINVCLRECKIPSEADFCIKLARSQEDCCQILLDGIKKKIKNNIAPDGDDLHILSMLPLWCDRKDRTYYRKEYFKIINGISY